MLTMRSAQTLHITDSFSVTKKTNRLINFLAFVLQKMEISWLLNKYDDPFFALKN